MKKLILLLLCSISLTGCNDWLEVRPQTQVRADQNFDTYKGFRDVLTGCYVKMNNRSLYGDNMTMSVTEALAQLWEIDNITNFPTLYPVSRFDYTHTASQTIVSSIYGNLFNVIVQANSILENIPEKGSTISNPNTRAIIEAEALAIRSFCQLDVLRLFGQLPQNPGKRISLPYLDKVSRENVPYYTYEQYIQKLEEDLLKAEELLFEKDPLFDYTFEELSSEADILEDSFLQFRQFRFNYYAVKALQARFYLYTNQTEKAYKAAKVVIDAKTKEGNQFITLATQEDYNKGGYALPSECLMALSNNELQNYIPNLLGGETTVGTSTLSLTEARFRDLFLGFETSLRNTFTWNRNTVSITSSVRRPSLKKYNPVQNLSNLTNRIIPILRLSELYLIAMETGPLSEANELYVKYMAARNVLTSTGFSNKELLDRELIKEYRREFYAEGQMFFTYKRKSSSSMIDLVTPVTEDNYLVPLPLTEINPNL
ncbi:RagB/SusD family nutrient uptake outer membrane protein [Sphingobacterium faecale]|uniref:RagB/SusD family nutrient uptake outer membrane protein n=1 Tax=Sphingobacterium faecale TaxID=2803775 RepID=A0ABS1R651_9SPHI|nr:RagB/SusD family nutrient uptake outer membrane protein [Sphingobacterium faecale]MBL1410039.1 RagB/SusD family nutrient uptake outer membrane protein [Sphingobacterium faecale]